MMSGLPLRTPMTATVQRVGFDVMLPCGDLAAKEETGYTKQEVHAFARQLGLNPHGTTLDCLCDKIKTLVMAKDPVSRAVVRNTRFNEGLTLTPATAAAVVHQRLPCSDAALSPAVTPLPLALMGCRQPT